MATFLTLKQNALAGYANRQQVTGTVASYTTAYIQDTLRQEPQGEWDRVYAYLRFTSGPASGTERPVTGWSAGNSTLAFLPSVPSLNASTNYQVTKLFTNSDVELAVNASFRDSYPERIVQSVASLGETFEARSFTVPTAAANPTNEVVVVDRAVGSTNYEYTTLRGGTDYDWDENNGVATLRAISFVGASGAYLRFHYRKAAAELSADTDTTDEPASVVILGARKYLALQAGDTAAVDRWGREFEQAKTDYIKNRPATQLRRPVFS